MKLCNVFYGFTKDGKYRCLYKKYRVYDTDYGEVRGTIYWDLEEKCELDTSFVDEKTLQPITNLLYGKRKTRRKIVNSYKKEFDKNVNLSHLFYGDIIYYFKQNGHCYENISEVTPISVKKDVLFRGISNGFASDFKTGEDYFVINKKIEEVRLNEHYIVNTRKLKVDFGLTDVIQPKRKVLEMDYRKEL